MSLIKSEQELQQWTGFLERRFIAVTQSEEAYVDAARVAHRNAIAWFYDDKMFVGSFRWVCDVLNLEADAVRRAVETKSDVERLRELM